MFRKSVSPEEWYLVVGQEGIASQIRFGEGASSAGARAFVIRGGAVGAACHQNQLHTTEGSRKMTNLGTANGSWKIIGRGLDLLATWTDMKSVSTKRQSWCEGQPTPMRIG